MSVTSVLLRAATSRTAASLGPVLTGHAGAAAGGLIALAAWAWSGNDPLVAGAAAMAAAVIGGVTVVLCCALSLARWMAWRVVLSPPTYTRTYECSLPPEGEREHIRWAA